MKSTTFQIRRKIIRAFLLCFAAVLVFAVLSFKAHLEIGKRLEIVELSDDLVNNVLEIRRYEKNFLLYGNPGLLSEALFFVNRVEGLWLKGLHDRHGGFSKTNGDSFLRALHQYKQVLTRIGSLASHTSVGGDAPYSARAEHLLRELGQELLSRAEGFRSREREAVKGLFRLIMILFVASMGVFFVLGLWAAFSISRQLVQPLAQMQQAMIKISLGDFTPIPESQCRTEELRPLFSAFNRMIRELEERQEQLIQARKIAAIGTLTSGIAHELNNPINNIVLTAETLKDELPNLTKEEMEDMLQDILNQSERTSEIVRNLLDFSRSERTETTSLSVNSVVQDTLRLVRNQMALSNVKLVTELHPDLPAIKGDAKGLQQVFLNLFINAIQAMPSGGTLSVSTHPSADGRWVEVEVSDTGVGIAPGDLPHIFDPFFTTKEVGKGTGLGLSVSYGIVKKHGGAIEVQSEHGKGSTFTVRLPAHLHSGEKVEEDGEKADLARG